MWCRAYQREIGATAPHVRREECALMLEGARSHCKTSAQEGSEVDTRLEQRKVAGEAIFTLANLKDAMVRLVLEPAGVPREIYRPLLKRDHITGEYLSKRKMAPLILDAVEKLPDGQSIVRRIVEVAAQWTTFDLAADPLAARVVVLQAQTLLSSLENSEVVEAERNRLAQEASQDTARKQQAQLDSKEADLLLQMFDSLTQSDNPQQRGFHLQNLLDRLFVLHRIPVWKPFQRNDGAEQIDGAFILEGRHFILECRWRQKPANERDLDGFVMQVSRSGKHLMGLFLSINGWSDHVPGLLRQNTEKSVLLMEGHGLRSILAGEVDLREFLAAMLAALNFEAKPYLSAREFLQRKHTAL
jgi:hypothetical protein